MYGAHIYIELEITLALAAIPARAMFGLEIEPQFNEPYLTTSLQDFWGRRWNLMVTSILRPTVYYPMRRISTRLVGSRWTSLPAIITVFVVSGLMHELMCYYATRVAPTWEMTWFFILHGVAVAAEVVVKKVVPEKMRLHPVVSGALAMGFHAVTAVWLFLPQLLRNGVDEKAIGEYFKLMDLLKVVVKKVVPDKMRLHPVVSGALALGFVAVTALWLFLPQLVRNGVDEENIGEYSKLMDLIQGLLPF
ncbi:hypothetical protein J1N35_028135 [Gossypium stocksii]|uniref:Wax synthase domain-containing protein n=1 Tax=Gossypium stocksii TaxID=47602 RepID=A0A9D3UVN3_9ROSI|nr:hypothetical protein J1N35_028135 [Gossypium stocksii]